MTDTRATQVSVEHWLTTSPPAQVTQVAVEHWTAVTTATIQTVVTQIAVEQWASVAIAGGGTQARAMVLA